MRVGGGVRGSGRPGSRSNGGSTWRLQGGLVGVPRAAGGRTVAAQGPTRDFDRDAGGREGGASKRRDIPEGSRWDELGPDAATCLDGRRVTLGQIRGAGAKRLASQRARP